MAQTTIEWTELTWNPVVGCTKLSPGCAHCYAERMAARLSGMARKNPDRTDRVRHYLPVINAAGRWSNVVLPVESALSDPSKWRTPRLVFVNSMSDLFHADVPHEFIQRVFRVMTEHPRHQFQVLTKRAERLAELASSLAWAPNIWMGVSVEAAEYASRVDALRSTPAHVRFLSLEPLLGPLYNLELDGIHWAIVGGESGPGARRTDPNWVIDLRDQCRRAGVPFFFKQWGNLRSNPDAADPTARENSGAAKGGRQLDGRIWQEMPNGAPSPDDNKPCRVNHEET